VEVVIVGSDGIDAENRAALRALWERAFGPRFANNDADHAYGGVHVLGFTDGRLISHASVIPRQIRFGDQPWRTVGYVEAVAVEPACQGKGLGRTTMARLQTEISSRWPMTSSATPVPAKAPARTRRRPTGPNSALGQVPTGRRRRLLGSRNDGPGSSVLAGWSAIGETLTPTTVRGTYRPTPS
jgi:GNAT superfamily N-acetyltransferase